jgi:hypothetical protein
MDKLMRSESTMACDTLVPMSQDREREMRDIARTEHFILAKVRICHSGRHVS